MAELESVAGSLTNAAGVDKATSDLMEEQRKRLLNSTPGIVAGVGGDRVGRDFSGLERRNAALGGDDSILKALQARTENRTGDVVGAMTRDISMMAPAREARGLEQVGQNLRTQAGFTQKNQSIDMQRSVNQQRVKMYRQQQQDALLGGILGIVGTVAGIGVAAATGGLSLLAGKGAGAGAMAGGMSKGAMGNIA